METQAAPSRAIRSYEDIEAFQRAMVLFQRAMVLLKTIHDVVLRFPDFEKFDLVQQMRRASKSIPANIAEGYSKRSSIKHFKLYLSNALGSTNEMIVHIQIGQKLGYMPREETNELIADYRIVGKQLTRLIEKWR